MNRYTSAYNDRFDFDGTHDRHMNPTNNSATFNLKHNPFDPENSSYSEITIVHHPAPSKEKTDFDTLFAGYTPEAARQVAKDKERLVEIRKNQELHRGEKEGFIATWALGRKVYAWEKAHPNQPLPVCPSPEHNPQSAQAKFQRKLDKLEHQARTTMQSHQDIISQAQQALLGDGENSDVYRKLASAAVAGTAGYVANRWMHGDSGKTDKDGKPTTHMDNFIRSIPKEHFDAKKTKEWVEKNLPEEDSSSISVSNLPIHILAPLALSVGAVASYCHSNQIGVGNAMLLKCLDLVSELVILRIQLVKLRHCLGIGDLGIVAEVIHGFLKIVKGLLVLALETHMFHAQ